MESRQQSFKRGTDVRQSLAEKLSTARALTGMSTRSAAEKLKNRFSISHATIANYESGRSTPPVDILAALADLYERPLNWFLERGKSLSGVRYRNLKSRVKINDLHRFEADVQRWVDAYVAIEARLKQPLKSVITDFKPAVETEASDLARQVRRQLKLNEDDPIPSVVELLENFGIRVIENPTELCIDGLAAKYDGEYIVVLNPTVSNDRGRLNAAHELAHVLLGDCDKEGEGKESEHRAFDFGSHLLLPNSQLKRAFEGRSMVRLVQFKERYGISLAAMVYRAEKLGFITKSTAKTLWIEFARRGWKTNEPGRVRPDRATRFEQMIDQVFASGRMSLKEVADLCGVRLEAVRERLNLAMGISGNYASEEGEASIFKFPE